MANLPVVAACVSTALPACSPTLARLQLRHAERVLPLPEHELIPRETIPHKMIPQ